MEYRERCVVNVLRQQRDDVEDIVNMKGFREHTLLTEDGYGMTGGVRGIDDTSGDGLLKA